MSEPITATTSSFIMPSPTQLIIGGVALGVGLTAGYGLACWTASLVDAGIEKTGIKDRVASLMGESEEVEEEDELEEDELEEDELEEDELEEDELEEDELEEDEDEVNVVKKSAKKAQEKAAV